MQARYRMFAGYNAWCNERLYDAAVTVSDADYRADRGAFFKSLHGTLNHILVGDRLWLVPGHCDPTVNLYDWIVGVRGTRVECVWPVAARGALG